MSMRGSTGGPPFGVQPGPPDKALVWNRSGATRALGDCLMLNLEQTGAETTNNLVGDTASGFANAILPITAQLTHGIFMIVTGGSLLDNGLMQVHFSGIIDCNVSGANAAALYEPLTAVNASEVLTSNVSTTQKIIGLTITVTAGAAEELQAQLFEGWHGFGSIS